MKSKIVKAKRWSGWLILGVIVLDQASKFYALNHFVRPIRVNDYWNWVLFYNSGVAFGFLANWGDLARYILSALAVLVCVGLAIWLRREQLWQNVLALSFIIGGALGNVIDRLRLGAVIDFIQWHIDDYYWPAFNVADSAISCGVFLLFLFSFQSKT